jgi:hypothetical protein
VSWIIGDLAYYGRTSIWLTRTANDRIAWNYAYRITRFDEYCAAVLRKKRCSKTHRVS